MEQFGREFSNLRLAAAARDGMRTTQCLSAQRECLSGATTKWADSAAQ
jgi:hypothetical protein